VAKERYEAVKAKYARVEAEIERVKKTWLPATDELNGLLASRGSSPVSGGASLAELIRRPELGYDCLAPFDPGRPELDRLVREQVEIRIKYEGYIARQARQIDEMRRLESRELPEDIDYFSVTGLRTEARQKLDKIRPQNLGQASRISGVSPADCAALMVWLGMKITGAK